MNTEWLKLRSFNGDIKNGFEELVCQLARAEKIKDRAKFIRVAAPDGGVEAYCILSDSNEYAWQAKFFTSMGDVQWKQLEKSFKKALDKHPKLVKYFVSLPLDRQDPRIDNQEWFMDKWNTNVSSWEAFAKSKGRSIEFEYWGNSELFDRLSKTENEGKLHYWFTEEEFSDKWFRQRLEESIKNLGKRYTPKLNFDLPIVKIFDGLYRDIDFKEQFLFQLDGFLKNFNKNIPTSREETTKEITEKITSIISNFKKDCDEIDFVEINIIDKQKLISHLDQCKELLESLIRKFYELDSTRKKNREKDKTKKEHSDEENIYGWDMERCRRLRGGVYGFISFLHGAVISLSNNPSLVLCGEAGIGKSHLLADIAKKKIFKGQFTILLLGQHFTAEEPWSQIKKLLHLTCERDVFLASINSKAEATQSRILIFIDAINEGEGKKLWKNHIAGFILAVKRFPDIGVVLSVRSSYEKILIPSDLEEQGLIEKVIHDGFSNYEYEASRFFFENFGIKQPSIPLLHPEFSNPLFLKLFCEALHKRGLNTIPEGYEGFSAIINFYLDAINYKIFESEIILQKFEIVSKVAKLIANKIAETGNTYLRLDEAFSIVSTFVDGFGISNKAAFFTELISEGLFTQNLYWDSNDNSFEGIYISYERFGDHLVCAYLIDNYIDKNNPKDSFKSGNRLFDILKDQGQLYFNKGILEALSIQLPEKIKMELYELVEDGDAAEIIAEAYIESIIWRKKESFTEKSRDYINKVVVNNDYLFNHFINTILQITSTPNHFYNSDFLHRNLMNFSMADRDAWWTEFLHNKYPSSSATPIRRAIDWAWTNDTREHIEGESIRLMCQTMIWFLTSTNRTLRDSATKALICLLEERIDVLIQLLRTFEKVNDPYVFQRLYAIAYGCAVRTTDITNLEKLANYIYQFVFNNDNVIADILLRDYARNIIEYSVHCGHSFDFDMENIRPPFKSELPNEFPTKEEIAKYEYDSNAEGFKDYYRSINAIIGSMKTNVRGGWYGDFGRYIFESAFSDWKDVDAQDLSNLAVKWIIEKYGYDVEKHGSFDRGIKSNISDRHYVMEERIGKKYQWIAFYELLARVSDNYNFYEERYSDDSKIKRYEGPWEPYIRDIDPTIVIKDASENKIEEPWWYKTEYSNWDVPTKDWIFKTDDLPNPLDLICVTDSTGVEWLLLEIHTSWREKADIGEDVWDSPHKELWYQLRSYITSKKSHKKIISNVKGKNFMGRWMPESGSRYEIFSREYYWSPACETFRKESYNEYSWVNAYDRNTRETFGKVVTTAVHYLWEEPYDASKKMAMKFYKPTELLFRLLGLKYSKIEGQLLNEKGELICFDPSAIYATRSCLVVRKKDLLKILEENDLGIFWTLLGEKLIIGDSDRSNNLGFLNISGVIHFESGELKHTPHFVKEK